MEPQSGKRQCEALSQAGEQPVDQIQLLHLLRTAGIAGHILNACMSRHYNRVRARNESAMVLCNLEELSKTARAALWDLRGARESSANPWRWVAQLYDPRAEWKMEALCPQIPEPDRDWRWLVKGRHWADLDDKTVLIQAVSAMSRTLACEDNPDVLVQFESRWDRCWLGASVYDLCTRKEDSCSDEMYQLASDAIRQFHAMLLQGCQDSSGPDNLAAIARAWGRRCSFDRHVAGVFGYLERYHIPRHNLSPLKPISHQLFVSSVLPLLDRSALLDRSVLDGCSEATLANVARMANACAEHLPGLVLPDSLKELPGQLEPEPTNQPLTDADAPCLFITSDGTEHQFVPSQVVGSGLLWACCERPAGSDSRGVVHLPALKENRYFGRVLSFLKYEAEHSEATDGERELWEAQFVSGGDDQLFALVLLANQLDCKRLLDLACKAIADEIKKCKSPQEIRRRFNIKNDFTPEEEQQVQAENAWAGE